MQNFALQEGSHVSEGEGQAMSEDFDERLRRQIAERERGTWREALRTSYAPWFDELDSGFQCGDGWSELLIGLMAEIANIVGGPDVTPDINVVQVKQKLGGLRCYVWDVPETLRDAVGEAVWRARDRSLTVCETCGGLGRMRKSREGYWHVACDEHAIP